MPRLVHISIDTTVKSVSITDADFVTGEVFLDYNGKMGQPLTFNRSSDIPYNDMACSIRIVTDNGSTGYFTMDDIDDVVVDGVSIGPSTLEDIINGIGAYLFTSLGGAPAPPSSATMIFNFGVGMQNAMFQRMSMQGTVTSMNINNISVYKVFLNDVEKSSSLPFTFLPGDRFFVECSRTNPATAASIDLITDGITNSIIFNSTTYYKPRTTTFVENMTTTQNYVDGIGVKGINNNIIFGRTNCIFTNPLKGAFELVIPPVNLANDVTDFYFGLNNLSQSPTPNNRYARMQYCMRFRSNMFQFYELNTSKATITAASNDLAWAKITSTYTSPGVYTIRFYWSTDDAATWTLLYTSLTTHNGTVNFHSDFVAAKGAYIQTHVAELTQN